MSKTAIKGKNGRKVATTGKKAVVKTITLDMVQRRVTLLAISQMSKNEDPRSGGKHGAAAMVRRDRLMKQLDFAAVDDWFIGMEEQRQKRIADPADPRITMSMDERSGDTTEYRLLQSYYNWTQEKVENAHYYGLLPEDVVKTLEVWGVDVESLDHDESDYIDADAEIVEVEEESEEAGDGKAGS